jgi:hypothetical protein
MRALYAGSSLLGIAGPHLFFAGVLGDDQLVQIVLLLVGDQFPP